MLNAFSIGHLSEQQFRSQIKKHSRFLRFLLSFYKALSRISEAAKTTRYIVGLEQKTPEPPTKGSDTGKAQLDMHSFFEIRGPFSKET